MIPKNRTPSGFVILIIFFLIILVQVGCEKGTLGLRGGSLSGCVLDSKTLVAISGVSVTSETGTGDSKATKSTATDTRGNYYLTDLRPGEWTIAFDKIGYEQIDVNATGAPKVVVVNNENTNVPPVRMLQTFINQYINVKGTLKDGRSGTLITLGTAQFIFGNNVFNNRLPTEFQTGFSIPATTGEMEMTIKVSGYDTYTTTISNAVTDRDLGVILLSPQTYKIVGVWKDVPGWVLNANPTANVVAYSGNKVVATCSALIDAQTFELGGIPMGTSVSLEAQIKGFRMNGSLPVVPNSDFQGSIYVSLSLKNNFAQILRDVRVIVNSTNITSGDRVGAYCNETGTVWPTVAVSGTGTLGTSNMRIVDLGVNQVPTGYKLTFTGFNMDTGSIGTTPDFVNDDGTDAQIVTIQVN